MFWLIQCWGLYSLFLNCRYIERTIQLAFLRFGDSVIFTVSPMGKCMKTMQKTDFPAVFSTYFIVGPGSSCFRRCREAWFGWMVYLANYVCMKVRSTIRIENDEGYLPPRSSSHLGEVYLEMFSKFSSSEAYLNAQATSIFMHLLSQKINIAIRCLFIFIPFSLAIQSGQPIFD